MTGDQDAVVFLVEDSVKRRMCWQTLRDHSLPKLLEFFQRPSTSRLQLFFQTGAPEASKGPFSTVRDWGDMFSDRYEHNVPLTLSRVRDALRTLQDLRFSGFSVLHLVIIACLPVSTQEPDSSWRQVVPHFTDSKTYFHLVQSGDLTQEKTVLERLFQDILSAAGRSQPILPFVPAQNLSFHVSFSKTATASLAPSSSLRSDSQTSKSQGRPRKSSASAVGTPPSIPEPIVEHIKQATGLTRRTNRNLASRSREPFVSEDAASRPRSARSRHQTTISLSAQPTSTRSRAVRGVEASKSSRSYSSPSRPTSPKATSPIRPAHPISQVYHPLHSAPYPQPVASNLPTQPPYPAFAPGTIVLGPGTASVIPTAASYHNMRPIGAVNSAAPAYIQQPAPSAGVNLTFSSPRSMLQGCPPPGSPVTRPFPMPTYPPTPASSSSSPSPHVEHATPPSSGLPSSVKDRSPISAQLSKVLSQPSVLDPSSLELNPRLKELQEEGQRPFDIEAARATVQPATLGTAVLPPQILPPAASLPSHTMVPHFIPSYTAMPPLPAVPSSHTYDMLPSPVSPITEPPHTDYSHPQMAPQQQAAQYNVSSSSSLIGWAG